MADKGLFPRLKRLFSTDVIIRNVGGSQIKVIDTDHIQSSGVVQTNIDTSNTVATSTNVILGTQLANIDLLSSTKIIYSFQASANATLSYQFANNAASAGRTSRTWKGSILKYKRID